MDLDMKQTSRIKGAVPLAGTTSPSTEHTSDCLRGRGLSGSESRVIGLVRNSIETDDDFKGYK
jgi:hypothetical protein